MYFQVLDDKKECVGIYHNGMVNYEPSIQNGSRTWKYSPYLRGYDIEYARLYCAGQTLEQVCPDHLKESYKDISAKMKAFLISFQEAKISLEDNCFFDLVPERFLLEFCEIKNEITKHIFENFSRPKNYRFLFSLEQMISDISSQKLNIDLGELSASLADIQVRSSIKKIKKSDNCISYDIFGTKTGRLSTKKNSFPIMTLNKSYRAILKPKNDLFLELDYNAAELRTLLALSGHTQPDQDIHEWNMKNVYGDRLNREESKKRIFSWLYNPESKDFQSEKFYERNKVLTQHWQGGIVSTPFGREIKVDRSKALNYLIQSTTSDAFLTQCHKIWQKLSEYKTNIAFLLHDSVVLDFASDERHLIPEMIDLFSQNDLGKFKVNVAIGKNYGDMRGLAING